MIWLRIMISWTDGWSVGLTVTGGADPSSRVSFPSEDAEEAFLFLFLVPYLIRRTSESAPESFLSSFSSAIQ
jgi:hypothetical protein